VLVVIRISLICPGRAQVLSLRYIPLCTFAFEVAPAIGLDYHGVMVVASVVVLMGLGGLGISMMGGVELLRA